MSIDEEIDILVDQAYEYLDEFDTKSAIKIGNKIKKLKHTSAFEVLALAYAQEDNIPEAILILREGIKVAPDVWVLWQLLGNYSSDEGNYFEAYKSYDEALNCPHVEESSIYLNYAIALKREEKHNKSLIYLDKIQSENDQLTNLSKIIRLEVLNLMGNHGEVINLANNYFSKIKEDEDESYLSSMYAEQGIAFWFLKKDANIAQKNAWEAIKINKFDHRASYLIREIENLYSPNSNYYRILIEGQWDKPIEYNSTIPNFFTSYDVVSETIDEALKFIKRFEPKNIRNSLKIDEYELLDNADDQPKGVYTVSGYSYYEPD